MVNNFGTNLNKQVERYKANISGGSVTLLAWFGSTWRERSLQINTNLFLVITFLIKHFYPEGSCLFQDDNDPVHTVREVTEWFDEYENNVNHMLWPSQSLRQCWTANIIKNTKWGNIFWKNCVHPSSGVQRLRQSMPMSTVLFWKYTVAQYLLYTLHVDFPFISQPSVYSLSTQTAAQTLCHFSSLKKHKNVGN